MFFTYLLKGRCWVPVFLWLFTFWLDTRNREYLETSSFFYISHSKLSSDFVVFTCEIQEQRRELAKVMRASLPSGWVWRNLTCNWWKLIIEILKRVKFQFQLIYFFVEQYETTKSALLSWWIHVLFCCLLKVRVWHLQIHPSPVTQRAWGQGGKDFVR